MLLPCSTLSMWGQTGQQMKLISYNIWNGFEGDSLRRARFIEWTRKQAADIFVLTELVGFKEKDLKTLGQVCGYPYAAIVKEEGYPVGVLSKQPIEVIKKQVEGFWHGMMHVKTAGVDVIATHLSPFEWKYRLNEAQQIVDYIQANHLKDYYVAGDLNAHSPLDADEIAKHDTLLANMQRWDLSQKYRVYVATSDALEQIIVSSRGAMRISAREFELLVKETHLHEIEEFQRKNKQMKNYLLEDLKKN